MDFMLCLALVEDTKCSPPLMILPCPISACVVTPDPEVSLWVFYVGAAVDEDVELLGIEMMVFFVEVKPFFPLASVSPWIFCCVVVVFGEVVPAMPFLPFFVELSFFFFLISSLEVIVHVVIRDWYVDGHGGNFLLRWLRRLGRLWFIEAGEVHVGAHANCAIGHRRVYLSVGVLRGRDVLWLSCITP